MKNLIVDKNLTSTIEPNIPSEKDEEILNTIMENIVIGIEKRTTNGELTYKPCTFCKRCNRMYVHHVSEFSKLKSGRYHSQCRSCRTEQANKWTTKRSKHRRKYQKNYRKSYIKPDEPKKRKPIIREVEDTELFVATLK